MPRCLPWKEGILPSLLQCCGSAMVGATPVLQYPDFPLGLNSLIDTDYEKQSR